MRSIFSPTSLTAQMTGRVILIVVVTAIIAALPGILILRHDLNQQAWSRVEQASNNMETLYTARQNELIAFAKLIAHRSCLQTQVKEKDQAGALEHLHDLVAGTEIQLVILCDVEGKFIASTLDLPVEGLCNDVKERGFVLIPVENSPTKISRSRPFEEQQAYQVWVTGSHFIGDHESLLGWTIAGIPANDALADVVHFQNGLEYSILYGNQPVVTSFAGWVADPAALFGAADSPAASGSGQRRTFEAGDQDFFAIRQRLAEAPALDYEVALSVTDIVTTQQRLIGFLASSILVVILFGSAVGVVMARRISSPLEQLTDTAVTFSSGDLSTPVQVATDLREVVLVARAIEDARSKLQQSITDLRKERAWTNHLIESIVEGILTLDEEQRITFFSHGAERITGWSREEVLGRPIDEVFRPAEAGPNAEQDFRQFLPPAKKESKARVHLAGSRVATLSLTGAALTPTLNEKAKTALVFRDVTDEEIVHRRLGSFIANITHEFRTPLSSLAASIELLQDQAPQIEPEDMEELLESLHLGILRLQTLIDNLIESASIETGHFNVSPHRTDFDRIVHEAAAMMTPLLAKYGQRLTVDLPDNLPPVWADSRRTMQVLVNLLSNANRYGPADSTIAIRAERRGNSLWVAVSDSGPGVPIEARSQLFQRHKPRGQKADPKAGSGLGLSVVKAIVEAQDGETGMEDCPGGGSQFWFTLKIEAAP